MNARLIAPLAGGLLALAAIGPAAAQQPPPPPQAVANPHYVTLVLEMDVARPAAAVWAKVGPFCAIGEWLRASCAITSGTADQLAAVRTLNGATVEMLVARTDLSYTYSQPVRVGVPFNAYHGTLEAKPVSASTSKLVYSFFYDNSMLADDAARATELSNRRARFMTALQNMKTLAEGGTLPPAPPR